jgi:hypothetical protein
MTALAEQELLDRAFDQLSSLLGDDDQLSVRTYAAQLPVGDRDAAWEIVAPNFTSPLLVEAYQRFTPRDADRVLGGVTPLVRKMMRDPPIVVVAPWLSRRSREVLAERNLNYIDLTGNVWLRVARPMVYLRLDGAEHDPDPPTRVPVRLEGAGINRLVRLLVDVSPPYRMVELARATGLSNAYVSRALEALDDERLIERAANRVVTDVDWPALLRVRADRYSLLKTNRAEGFIARAGANALLRRLVEGGDDAAVVTGSYAASALVRVAVATQLALYVPSQSRFAEQHDLMSAEQGANVLLLRAADASQLHRQRRVEDFAHVGLSQLALDCLAGNGRLPEEGEAIIEWMDANVSAWRLGRLPDPQ